MEMRTDHVLIAQLVTIRPRIFIHAAGY